jgi:hypothetical protein
MIYTIKDTATVCIATFTQSATLTNPYFLLKIVSNFNAEFEPLYVAITDTSTTQERYNEFELDLDIPKGEYTYYCFECVDPNPVDEDDATGDYIQTDLLIVYSNDDLDNNIYL